MKTILVVDDEPKILQIARDYLENAGYSVIAAGDGAAALHRAQAEQPDLVVLDLGLPGMDGLDVCRPIRRSSEVPIIMLSAAGEETDRVLGLEVGADDYLPKPFSPRELLSNIEDILFQQAQADLSTSPLPKE